MIDVTKADLSVFPARQFFRAHSCLSAYTEAARLSTTGVNIFDTAPYSKPGQPDTARTIGPLDVDLYQYPPPFLALPRLTVAAGLEFLTTRRLWFAVQSVVLLLGVVVTARWIGGVSGLLALLLAPFLWLAPTTRVTLQIGNFQLTAFALSMLAMIAFERRHAARGGLMLGFSTVSKVFPGTLGVLLVTDRRSDERPLDDRLGGGVRDRHPALDRQRPVQRFLQLSAASHSVRRRVLLDRRAGDGTRQLRDSRLDHQASRPRRPVDECRGGELRGKPLRSAPSGDCCHRREPPGKDARDGEEPRVAAPATGASLAGATQSRVVPQPVRARRLRPRRHVVAADIARSRRTLAHDRAPCPRRRGRRHVRGARWRRAASSASVVDCDGKSCGAARP